MVSKNFFLHILKIDDFENTPLPQGFREKHIPSQVFWEGDMNTYVLLERLAAFDRSAHQVVSGRGSGDKFSA